MFRDYRIIVVTPAGRKRYLEILFRYIFKNRHIIDEYHLWLNTDNQEDIDYCKFLQNSFFFVKVIWPKIEPSGNTSIHHFYSYCTDPKTIYIKIDDDIVYLGKLENLLTFRIENPQYFIVSANVINNGICNHLHQRLGMLIDRNHYAYNCADSYGWANPNAAENAHRHFLAQKPENYYFGNFAIRRRFSINCISWIGGVFNGVGQDDEHLLTCDKNNAICGNFIVSHFAYYTQRDHLDNTNLLHLYKMKSLENYEEVQPETLIDVQCIVDEHDRPPPPSNPTPLIQEIVAPKRKLSPSEMRKMVHSRLKRLR